MLSGLGLWVGALPATTRLSARRVGESGRRLVACGSSRRPSSCRRRGWGAPHGWSAFGARAVGGACSLRGVRIGGRGRSCILHRNLGFAVEVARPLQHLTTSLELARTRGIRLFN